MVSMIVSTEFFRPGASEEKHLMGRLKYLQYRNDRDGHIAQEQGLERWVDCGMGNNYRSIAINAQQFASAKVLTLTFVLSPDPKLMKKVDPSDHQRLMHDITEAFMERFFAERGFLVPPEFSFVVHHKNTLQGDAQPHSHVVMAATSMSGFERVPFELRKPQMQQMRAIADELAVDMVQEYVEQRDLIYGKEVEGPVLPAVEGTGIERELPRRPEPELVGGLYAI